ncbi:unnamed protein product [Plutella xylostella]|uniref:(diamondback moth) hypothetical protein n=1 Tax=Plutella xylostella TaxID=51655 RepID=A0A8S4F776_PLUXY|nr:unnamed protein product [Plutella xylostella]
MGANKTKTWINCLKDENGVKHSHRDNITTICTTFYKNLYSDANKNELPDIEYTCPDTIPPITGQEVYTALKSMKYDKSPGEDGITTEALKVDYSKAFDSITHNSIFTALQNQDVDPTYIQILKKIYNNSTADIKLQNPGPLFNIEKGVKQGDPLSPKLFTATLEEVFKKLAVSWERKGIDVGGRMLTNLRFADDIVLFASSASELTQMLQDLSTASLEVGLKMNRSKTQVMTNSAKSRVVVDGQEIGYVDEYIYLGQIASFENRQDKEVERRINNAWKSFWSMKDLMKGTLPLTLKRRLIDMCILPVLTYGAQTWSLTEHQKSKLKVCQRAMERTILGVRRIDRIRNTTLRSSTRIADVGAQTAKLKWAWAGHVCRMHPDRWARIVTEWVPSDGRRRRGRRRRRWRDDLDRFLPQWPKEAHDRERWSPCKGASKEARAEQCAAYDRRPFRGRFYTWVPYVDGNSPCTLNCRPRGQQFYASLGLVSDGTPCTKPGFRAICVQGACKAIKGPWKSFFFISLGLVADGTPCTKPGFRAICVQGASVLAMQCMGYFRIWGAVAKESVASIRYGFRAIYDPSGSTCLVKSKRMARIRRNLQYWWDWLEDRTAGSCSSRHAVIRRIDAKKS